MELKPFSKSPEEYQNLKTELESIGYNFDVLNSTNESTGAAGGAGAFSPALGYEKKKIYEENESQDEPDDENDCFISSNGFKYSVSCVGKYIGEFVEMDDALKAKIAKEFPVLQQSVEDTLKKSVKRKSDKGDGEE